MKKYVIALLLSIVNCQLSMSQIGTWRNYLSYYEVQQIQAAGDDIFVMASNSLYQYNKQDQSIYTYDKTKGLSDTGISNIKWCQQGKRLVVVYSNSNIDLVETNGNVTNISDLYTKAISGGKNIYSIAVNGQYAYLACDFGIVKINVKDGEISESYMLNFPITAVAFDSNTIYAQSQNNGIWKGSLNKNLIDPNNWEQTANAPSFEEDKTDYNNYIDLVKTLQPGGPKYNWFDYLKFTDGRLYTTGGKHLNYTLSQRNGTIQIWDGTNWSLCQDNLDDITGYQYRDVTCVEVDPKDHNHLFATSSHSGLYEFNNGQLVKYYNADNSILYPVAGDKNMLLTDGVIYDQEGNLWVSSGWSKSMLIKITPENQWINYFDKHQILQDNRTKLGNLIKPILDSKNRLWFANAYWEMPAAVCYDINNDVVRIFSNIKNQDGTKYIFDNVYCVKEDMENNIWVGTNIGLFMLEPNEIEKENYTFTQIKVPRNDGTDYADYLLNGLAIYDIIIDGANRKWVATNNGVYLISSNNQQQIHHFTTDNSKLLADDVYTCALNPNSGEVYFCTEKGLCSYISDATSSNSEMNKDNVWAYPNPVTPDYTGLITIVGLTYNADVKILAANGALIAEGRSNGGTFVWDGCSKNGNRVASGIYMVATATSDGKKGTVCKIAIIR